MTHEIRSFNSFHFPFLSSHLLLVHFMRTIFMIIHAFTCNNNTIVSEMKEKRREKRDS